MRVLFVSSGNSTNGISSIVMRQGASFNKACITIDYFTIKGKGLIGYLANFFKLRRAMKVFKPDIIHAHYSLSAFLATIVGFKPLVVSLMGSDVKSSIVIRALTRLFSLFFWQHTIVKSEDMKKSLGLKNVSIIPNGVNVDLFKPLNKTNCQNTLQWNRNMLHILFAANPSRPEKNFPLLQEALDLINNPNICLHTLSNVIYENVPIMMNAADVVILTSLWEGSPNVIKEAMACSRPIVTTEVGDVKWVLGETVGCYISEFSAFSLKEKLLESIEFSINHKFTKGRERIFHLKLNAESVANNIELVYMKTLKK